MFINYNNTLYDSLNEKTHLVIITRVESKIDEQFLKSRKSYYKEISTDDTNIQDIFDVKFYLDWDSHFERVDKTWEISTQINHLVGEQVLLEFVKGQLPGWKLEEQIICSKYVDINECENFTAVYTYDTKDGQRLENPLKVEEKLTKEKFIEKVIQYRNRNI